MLIYIKGLQDDRFARPLQLIANLFFEETEVCMEENEQSDLTIDIRLKEESGQAHAMAVLTAKPSDKEYTASYTKKLTADGDKERLKQMKMVASHVFLSVLQEYTSITQKWGILTGMRPTKLFHKHRQAGLTTEEVRQKLQSEYMITEEKIDLMEKILERQLTMVPDLYDVKDEVSIYIGIPFCPTKCAYCTFPAYAIQGKQGRVASFLSGLHYEMEQIGRWLQEKGVKITTVYYGGGTPTAITAEEMDELYALMYEVFPDVENIREITVEAGRPDTITPEKLSILKKWNIDRISINPQSYTQETLKAIGRHHTVEETIEKYHMAKQSGMNNINMDLIIGLPGEGTEEFAHSLDETEKLMPESLTVHTLSFKRASEMTLNKEKYQVADRKEVEKMMNMAEEWTSDHGYVPYYLYRQKNILGNLENVGYSKPGQESIYNIMIMEEVQTIIGIGCGAASKFIDRHTGKIEHFSNPKDPKTYNERFVEYTEKKLNKLNELFSDLPVR
ncbi:coproporphyrinogen III oxidase [Bacillus thermotolerans]|uniref:Coproporphyrinogen III oxidase, oxygen-independent n=1 Tax=Bacillus thermotolerans TaxID=1221996 RepID=A0A0F5HQI7_BACTR|nr:coproporphyrinogen III oxidase [Bacillus thermotolerans]KKB35624.1 Coproporphyrinogen III oxidase, oxygen-independent [Bacillus thermotolerans]KKB40455.1 Coproporphyrinogen III oxidase, oxygen-independent [Bacillus thermotolerans]